MDISTINNNSVSSSNTHSHLLNTPTNNSNQLQPLENTSRGTSGQTIQISTATNVNISGQTSGNKPQITTETSLENNNVQTSNHSPQLTKVTTLINRNVQTSTDTRTVLTTGTNQETSGNKPQMTTIASLENNNVQTSTDTPAMLTTATNGNVSGKKNVTHQSTLKLQNSNSIQTFITTSNTETLTSPVTATKTHGIPNTVSDISHSPPVILSGTSIGSKSASAPTSSPTSPSNQIPGGNQATQSQGQNNMATMSLVTGSTNITRITTTQNAILSSTLDPGKPLLINFNFLSH